MEDWEQPSCDQEAIAPSNQQFQLLPASLAEAVHLPLQDLTEEEEEEDHLKEAKAHWLPCLLEDPLPLNQEE